MNEDDRSSDARPWIITTVAALVLAAIALAFAAGLTLARPKDETQTQGTVPPATVSATSTTSTTTTSTTTTTLAPTTTTMVPTTAAPTTDPPDPVDYEAAPGLQEWSDRFAAYQAGLSGITIDPESDDPCGPMLAAIEAGGPPLASAPTSQVGAAFQAYLSQQRFYFRGCMTLGLSGAEIEGRRLRDLRQAVIQAIYDGGAVYSG